MIKNVYVVLSVKDIRRMLKVAIKGQKASLGKTSTHCLVFEDLEIVQDSNQCPQLSSASVNSAVRAVDRRINERKARL